MPSLDANPTPILEPSPEVSPEGLKAAWQRLREANPMLRIRDAAEQLGVSEAELLALNCGDTSIRLEADWAELIRALPALGRVMALTRNDHAVHEKEGRYADEDADAAWPDDGLDLLLLPGLWRFGFAVTERGRGGERQSLQFFDALGGAVHKVYLVDASDRPAYESLVERYTARDQSPAQAVARGASPEHAGLPAAPGFLAATGQRHVEQVRDLQRAGNHLARPVAKAAAEQVLTLAAAAGLPLAITVPSPGAVQTHTGTVHNIQRTGPWINVLDEGFNLHLRDTRVDSSWVVREPLPEGGLTVLELFDGAGLPVARFACGRSPGEPEPEAWRDVLDALPAGEGEA